MKFLFPGIVGLIIFIFTNPLFSQINTERYRMESEHLGFQFSNSLSFVLSKGNTDEIELGNNFRTDYFSQKMHYFSIVDYNYKTAGGIKARNNGFVHIRTVADLKHDIIMIEGFTQWQFDEFILLKNRWLIGSGLRINMSGWLFAIEEEEAALNVFVGSGLMYEYEDYSIEPLALYRKLRSTNYLSLVWSISEHANMNLVNYYQPNVASISDFRFSSYLGFRIRLVGQLSIGLNVTYEHRSRVVGDKVPNDLKIRNTLTLNLP